MTAAYAAHSPHPASLRVALGQGRNLFERFADPRIEAAPAGEFDQGEADLIVVSCGASANLKLDDRGVPAGLWAAAAAGRAVVLFDASGEGHPHTPQHTREIHGFLDARGIARSAAVYVTQDRNYRADYLAHCAGSADPGGAVGVVCHDYWIWKYAVRFAGQGPRWLGHRLKAFESRRPSRPRRFVSLNFTPRVTKVLFLLSLLRDGLWDQGFISFGGFEEYRHRYQRSLPEFEVLMRRCRGFEDLVRELSPLLPRLDLFGQTMLTEVTRDAGGRFAAKAPLLVSSPPAYGESWFSVITETEMAPRASRITEKPLAALVNLHPLLILGNPGALQMVRELGFVTFEEVIDERYDLEPDPRRRFDMVYAIVRRLCGLDEAELERMENAIAEKLVFNARWGLVELPNKVRTDSHVALIDEILLLTGRR